MYEVRRWSQEALKKIVHEGPRHKRITDVAMNGIWPSDSRIIRKKDTSIQEYKPVSSGQR